MNYALAPSLHDDFDSIGIKTSSGTCLQKTDQKIKRVMFTDWLTHLYLALSLGGNPIKGGHQLP